MKTAITITFATIVFFCLGLSTSKAQDDEFSFDFEEFSKSPWVVDGFLQGNLDHLTLNQESAFYKLANLNKENEARRTLGGAEIQLGVTYQHGSFTMLGLGKLEQIYTGFDWENNALLYKGRAAWQINPNAFVTAGKILPRWGKGYAWNPTNFAGRLKNPSDPDLSLEGHWATQFDFVKSFNGALKNVAFTGIILPVSDNINTQFGEYDHVNIAGKIYLLFHDTDIDFMALSSGSKPGRFGLTLSRNVTANFEIHGEAAYFLDHSKSVIENDGRVSTESSDVQSYLAGIRYLSSTNTTYILEYYYNGHGYSVEENENLFHYLDGLNDQDLAGIALHLADYQLPNYMHNYLYFKASQKEPFGWLYLTPSLYTIVNADDGSYNIIPEAVYTGVENLELRIRTSLLFGQANTEYGEKINDWKLELRARYYF